MTVRQTSKNAYHGVPVTNQQHIIITAVERFGEVCIADLADYLGWERSTVSGRVNDLKKAGLLVEAGKRPSKATGITAIHCKIKQRGQLMLFI